MSLKNKVAIITGAASGIGASTALLFAKEEANVIIVDIDEAGVKKTAAQCSEYSKCIYIKTDAGKEDDVSNVINKTIEEFGKINILINNAGHVVPDKILDGSVLKHFDHVINTNLRSVVLFTTLAAPYLLKTKGCIVNMSSVVSFMPKIISVSLSYCMAKTGIATFTEMSAAELGPFGVRVNAVCPGPVKTNILANANLPEDWDHFANTTVLNRNLDPEEVSDLILYLVSDKAKSITGSHYLIDGGMLVK